MTGVGGVLSGLFGGGMGLGARGSAVVRRDVSTLGVIEDVGAVRTIGIVVLVRLQLGDRRAADEVDLVVGVRDRDRQRMSPRCVYVPVAC